MLALLKTASQPLVFVTGLTLMLASTLAVLKLWRRSPEQSLAAGYSSDARVDLYVALQFAFVPVAIGGILATVEFAIQAPRWMLAPALLYGFALSFAVSLAAQIGFVRLLGRRQSEQYWAWSAVTHDRTATKPALVRLAIALMVSATIVAPLLAIAVRAARQI